MVAFCPQLPRKRRSNRESTTHVTPRPAPSLRAESPLSMGLIEGSDGPMCNRTLADPSRTVTGPRRMPTLDVKRSTRAALTIPAALSCIAMSVEVSIAVADCVTEPVAMVRLRIALWLTRTRDPETVPAEDWAIVTRSATTSLALDVSMSTDSGVAFSCSSGRSRGCAPLSCVCVSVMVCRSVPSVLLSRIKSSKRQ